MRRLGIVLGLGPGSAEARLALGLARAGRERGVSVHLFAMDQGVRIGEAPFWRELSEAAAEIVLCATTCEQLAVTPPDGAELGSQRDHAALIRTCDRVLALT